MDPICAFFSAHLIEIYFFYGLAFFVTGIVVWLEASRHADLQLAQVLPFLAAFALLHGGHEWLEMFEKIAQSPPSQAARLFRLAVLYASFLPLLEFGLRLMGLSGRTRWRSMRWVQLSVVAGGSILITLQWASAGPQAWIPALDAWCRYSLAIPGSVIAAVALYAYMGQERRESTRLPCELQIVALALFLYGVPGQLFVGASALPPSNVLNSDLFFERVHVPIQLVRTLMATAMAIFMARGVRCFERERRRRVDKLARAREEAQRRLTREMAERKRLQSDLLHRIVQAQEEERRHIARELHDETAQALTALSLGLRNLEEVMGDAPREANDELEDLRRLVESTMESINGLTARLRPIVLDDLGLVPALVTYARESRSHLPFDLDVQITGDRRRLSPEAETNLYRIAQESLTNVARHADANHVVLHLDFAPASVTLRIDDDGVGMDPRQARRAAASGEGWGLAGIEERAQLLGGEMVLRSSPGAGTEVEVTIPAPDPTDNKGHARERNQDPSH